MVRNWEIQVHFKVHGKGNDLFGDGFAIWYTKDYLMDGQVFGNKDFFQGLAVILDTYSNHNGVHNVSFRNLTLKGLLFYLISLLASTSLYFWYGKQWYTIL